MAVVGEIAVNVAARTAGFVKGMKKASGSTRKFAASVKKSLGVIKGFGIAAAASGTAAAVAFARVAKTIDQVAKDSVRLGITTESLLGLNFAAGIFGATSEDVTKAILRQQKAISEAGVGLMTQKRAFEQLGLSLDRLNSMSPDRQFLEIASALKQVGRETDQVRITQDIFGRGGANLLAFLRASDSEIRAQIKTVKELGAAYSNDGAAKVEEFNDELLRLRTLIGGEAQKLVIDIAPEAIAAIRFLQDYVRESARLIKGAVKLATLPERTLDSVRTRIGNRIEQGLGRGGKSGRQIRQEQADREFQNRAIKFRSQQQERRLREVQREQSRNLGRKLGPGIAGRAVLRTIGGATGLTNPRSQINQAVTDIRTGFAKAGIASIRFGRQLDNTRKKNEIAARREKQEARFDELLALAGQRTPQLQQKAATRFIEATSVEGLSRIRQSRRPQERMLKISEEQLKELKSIGQKLDRSDEVQELLT